MRREDLGQELCQATTRTEDMPKPRIRLPESLLRRSQEGFSLVRHFTEHDSSPPATAETYVPQTPHTIRQKPSHSLSLSKGALIDIAVAHQRQFLLLLTSLRKEYKH